MAILVNGELVEDSVIRQEAAALRPRYEEAMGDMDPVEREMQLRDWSKENVIERVLLRQEAWKDPEPVPEEQFEEAIKMVSSEMTGQPGCEMDPELIRKEAETRIRVERLIRRITAKVGPPKPREVTDYYKKNKEVFLAPELVRASHVVKNVRQEEDEAPALEAIQKAREEIQGGADFAEVADKYSDCAGNGGDLGYFPPGEMVEEFEKVVFGMNPGETSDVFRSAFGYHVARVVDRRPAGIRKLEDVKDDIEAILMRGRQEKAVEDYLDKLRAEAKVETVRAQKGEKG